MKGTNVTEIASELNVEEENLQDAIERSESYVVTYFMEILDMHDTSNNEISLLLRDKAGWVFTVGEEYFREMEAELNLTEQEVTGVIQAHRNRATALLEVTNKSDDNNSELFIVVRPQEIEPLDRKNYTTGWELRKLVESGISPEAALDFYATNVGHFSKSDWAKSRGVTDSEVTENVLQAKKNLPDWWDAKW